MTKLTKHTDLLVTALEILREDMRMLRDDEWDGSPEGAQVSINIADTALEKYKSIR